jgi:hypothetical protein
MVVTLLGIAIEVSAVQPANASVPILVTLLGIIKETRDEQPEYLQIIVYQFVSIKTVEK